MEKAKTTIRLFIAAALPPDLLRYFAEKAAAFPQKDWRLVPEQNLHATLLFIGNVPTNRLMEIRQKLPGIAAAHNGFTLQFESIEPGPEKKSPRLVWARFNPEVAFAELATHLQAELAPEVKLPKKMIPHVTLARRRKDSVSPEALLPVFPEEPLALKVNEIGIWQSVLGSPHPAYHVLDRFTLAKPGQHPST